MLGYTRPFRQSGLVLSPFPSDFIGLNGCSIYPYSSVPNLAKRSLLFVGSGWVKGDPLIPFLCRLRFSSALRDGIGVFKPSSPSTKKMCFFYSKRPPSPAITFSISVIFMIKIFKFLEQWYKWLCSRALTTIHGFDSRSVQFSFVHQVVFT